MNENTSRLVSEVFVLLGVDNFKDLSLAYSREDQVLMKSQAWNAYNSSLITNRVKAILEQIDPEDLGESDRMWRDEILWFWYHHAVSCERNRIQAQSYADKALGLQSDDHPNQITKLLWFLTHDKVNNAKEWVAKIPTDSVEHQTGIDVIEAYEERKFWE
jgi:hypothetical protein